MRYWLDDFLPPARSVKRKMVISSHYKEGFHNQTVNCFLVQFCLAQLCFCILTVHIPFRKGADVPLLWLTKCSDQRSFLVKCTNFWNHYFLLKKGKSHQIHKHTEIHIYTQKYMYVKCENLRLKWSHSNDVLKCWKYSYFKMKYFFFVSAFVKRYYHDNCWYLNCSHPIMGRKHMSKYQHFPWDRDVEKLQSVSFHWYLYLSSKELLLVFCHWGKKSMESGDKEGTSWVNLICSLQYHVNLIYVLLSKIMLCNNLLFPKLVYHPKFILTPSIQGRIHLA